MSDGTGLAEAMLGMEGFRVLDVSETPGELMVTVETTRTVEGCRWCGLGLWLMTGVRLMCGIWLVSAGR